MKRRSLDVRFWEKVQKTEECWVWAANKSAGYGLLKIFGRPRMATHVSWFIAHGVWPPSGLFVCHRCDNPSCVRPDHLFLGTAADNAADRDAKGRGVRLSFSQMRKVRGVEHGSAKLTDEQVREILAMAGRYTQEQIGRRFGISQSLVSAIHTRRIWRHVAAPEAYVLPSLSNPRRGKRHQRERLPERGAGGFGSSGA